MQVRVIKIVKRMINSSIAFCFECWWVAKQDTNPIHQSVCLTLPADFESISRSEEAQEHFNKSLKEQISTTLNIDPGIVQVLCLQRGSVKAEIILSDVFSEDEFPRRSAAMMAKELAKACLDDQSIFAQCGLKLSASHAEVHGAISQAVLHAVQSSMLAQQTKLSAALAMATLTQERGKGRAVYMVKRMFLRSLSVSLELWHKHVKSEKEKRTKSKRIILQMMQSGSIFAFDNWRKHAKDQHRSRTVGQRAIWKLKNKAIVLVFNMWKSNIQSTKQMSRELGQNARFFYAAVSILQGRRNSMFRWRSIRAWQQRAFETKEFEAMCDKMGGLVDSRMYRRLLSGWQKTARSFALCRYAIERRDTWGVPLLLQTAVFEWYSLASVANRRQQIIGILRSRLPRKIISAWTHSFAWRRCVDGRSIRIAHICAARVLLRVQALVMTEWCHKKDWYRKVRVLANFWVYKLLFRWSNYRAKYRFHRTRAMDAPQHDVFIENLKRPERAAEDRMVLGYQLAGRVIGDVSLTAKQDPRNISQAQALYSRAWLFVHRHDLHDLRPALEEIDVRVQSMSHEVEALTDVGLTIGSRVRVSWNIKVKKEQSSALTSSKQDALETWTDIWWGCTVLSRAVYKDKERDPQGNALWNVIYGEFELFWICSFVTPGGPFRRRALALRRHQQAM